MVALANGKLVGTVMGGYDGHRGWVYSLAVDDRERHRGIGSALIDKIEEALKALGCLKVNLQVVASNSGVVGFYEKLGFSVEDRISMGKRLYSESDLHNAHNGGIPRSSPALSGPGRARHGGLRHP